MDPDKVGKFIFKLRTENNLSQYQLADMIPISRQAISKWERGQTIPDSSTLLRLSDIFGVTINELLKGKRLEEKTITQLEKTTLDIVDESNRKTKKIKKMLTVFISIFSLLLITFLSYYFMNSYNSIRVYMIGAKGKNYDIHDGIFITTKQKSYLKIGTIQPLTESKIDTAKLYYKKGTEKIIISEDMDIDRTIIRLYGYNEFFAEEDINLMLKNSYIEITSEAGEIEEIPLTFQRDFTNTNFLFKKETTKELQEEPLEEEKAIIEEEIIKTAIKEKGKEIDKNYIYEVTDKNNEIKIVYFSESSQLKLMINDSIVWTYIFNVNRYICEDTKDETISEESCQKKIQEDVNKYLLEGSN